MRDYYSELKNFSFSLGIDLFGVADISQIKEKLIDQFICGVCVKNCLPAGRPRG